MTGQRRRGPAVSAPRWIAKAASCAFVLLVVGGCGGGSGTPSASDSAAAPSGDAAASRPPGQAAPLGGGQAAALPGAQPPPNLGPLAYAPPDVGPDEAFVGQVLTLDTHVDIPLDFATPAVDPKSGDLQVNLDKMRRGGLDAAFFIVYVGQTARTPENYVKAQMDAMRKFDAIHRMAEDLYPDEIGIATSPADVERLAASGKLVAAIGIENGYVIGKDLGLLDKYYALGARYMTLVHNGHNDLGDSAQPSADLGDGPEEHGGLSDFGRAVVARMNDLGMMVDISHASKKTELDAIRASRAPVIASHSGVTAVAQHVRNLDDETLLALRDNGGVVQIVAFDAYDKYQPPEEIAAMQDLRTRLGLKRGVDLETLPDAQRIVYLQGVKKIQNRWPPATVDDLVDHIDYAVALIGIDHVGISSDFGGGGGVVGWSDASETGNVTRELLSRGYSKQDIEKLWGGNLLRVWGEVEKAAKR
ncbi:MAG TPA: dipeptidase [Gammaproteobacteria bacterium]|nr:dipeptidase [Gammaproteobacteria bacterium]